MPFPVDSKFIRDTEVKLSMTFPSTFVGRMSSNNGGSVDAGDATWELFPFRDSSDRKRIARTCNDIVLETNRMKKWPSFPAGAVAIASNGTGDQLIFLPEEGSGSELAPAVYRWDHETGDAEKVADDFADLR